MGKRLSPLEKELILKGRVKGWGYRKIGKEIGRNPSTVKLFLDRTANGDKPLKSNKSLPTEEGVVTETKVIHKFSWMEGLDKSGEAMLGLFGRALEAGDERTAMHWMDRFIKAYSAYMGGIRIQVVNDNRDQSVNVGVSKEKMMGMIRELKKVDGKCPLCHK